MTCVTRKQFLDVTALAGAAAFLTGCGSQSARIAAEVKKEGSITVFASASLTECLTEASEVFTDEKGAEVSINFDASDALGDQIQEGAECDVFICAGQTPMNELDAEDATGDNGEGLDLIESSTRFNLLKNEVVLAVPAGNPKGIVSFDDLAARLLAGELFVCVGSSDEPVGECAQEILAYYGLSEAALASAENIIYGTSAEEVASQVVGGAADCGIVYKTDAYSASLEVVDAATDEMCNGTVYPAAVVKGTSKLTAARAYLEFLKGTTATSCFQEAGFTPLASE